MKVIYETERLIVRQWENKDEQDLYEYASDNSVTNQSFLDEEIK